MSRVEKDGESPLDDLEQIACRLGALQELLRDVTEKYAMAESLDSYHLLLDSMCHLAGELSKTVDKLQNDFDIVEKKG